MIGLKYIRKLYGMSMEELAKKIGVSKQTVSKWESRKINITEENLEKISKLFCLDKEIFFKELSKLDELNIQKCKIENEPIKVHSLDEDDGYSEMIDIDELEFLDYKISIQSISDRVNNILKKVSYRGLEENEELYSFQTAITLQKFVELIESRKVPMYILNLVLDAVLAVYLPDKNIKISSKFQESLVQLFEKNLEEEKVKSKHYEEMINEAKKYFRIKP